MDKVTATTPFEIDKALYELDGKLPTAQHRLERARVRVHAEQESPYSTAASKDAAEKTLREASEGYDRLVEEWAALNRAYTGWNRYWLVTNTNGHVHSTTDCSTCFPTTRFARLYEYSDMDRDEFVQLAGEKACTTCFPDAPVNKPSQIEDPETKAKREAREADKARKQAEKAAKGITTPEGGPLYEWTIDFRTRELSQRGEPFKTERAASNLAIEQAFDLKFYSHDHPSAPAWRCNVERILISLAHKRGTSVEQERAALAKKVKAKAKRDGYELKD